MPSQTILTLISPLQVVIRIILLQARPSLMLTTIMEPLILKILPLTTVEIQTPSTPQPS